MRPPATRDGPTPRGPLPREEFVAALSAQGARYWDKHPFQHPKLAGLVQDPAPLLRAVGPGRRGRRRGPDRGGAGP